MKKLLNVIKKIICVFGGIILILVIQISICIWRHHGRGIEKGESAEALTVEGQKPDAVIPYEENGKKWYFWYFTDLQSDKEGNELEYTLKQ